MKTWHGVKGRRFAEKRRRGEARCGEAREPKSAGKRRATVVQEPRETVFFFPAGGVQMESRFRRVSARLLAASSDAAWFGGPLPVFLRHLWADTHPDTSRSRASVVLSRLADSAPCRRREALSTVIRCTWQGMFDFRLNTSTTSRVLGWRRGKQ